MPADESDSSSSTDPAGVARWLSVDVVEEAGDWQAFGDVAALAARAAAAVAGTPDLISLSLANGRSEACVALADDAGVQVLNRQYRGKDKPTNVLSFPAPGRPAGIEPDDPRPLGDIILAQETVAREAREQCVSPEHHFQHLVVHGLLHLLGYDHETDEEAEAMEALEIAILARLGIANPYEGEIDRRAVIQS